MSTVMSSQHSLLIRLKTGAKDCWGLIRSPDTLYLGLKRKGVVPALLLLSLALVPLVLLPIANLTLEKIYPPITEKKLFGLLHSTAADERLEVRKSQSAYLIWTLAGVAVVIGLIGYAPIVRFSAEIEKEELLKSLQQASGVKGPLNLEDRYRVDDEIGSGAMGVVFSAFDMKLERNVALKELPSVFIRDSERRERFRREALTLAKLTHPGIVQIYDLLDDGERIVLVMELVKGGTLESLIANKAPFAVAEACRLVESISETLAHVHQKGIVHRDLKPANILIDENQNLKVTDFGLARLRQESRMTLDGSVMGSPNYMSPEQAAGQQTDYRTDIYALGIIFYELLTGAPPYTGELAAVMVKQISENPTPPSERIEGLDHEVDSLVMAMLNKNPDERLSDFHEIRARLQRLQD
ncbi:MAG: serine/threonine protein kinase [Desulfuromonadales bacterium]|nr:serine/threonine protein kinase [Desulfuromonadales bacterium]